MLRVLRFGDIFLLFITDKNDMVMVTFLNLYDNVAYEGSPCREILIKKNS